MNVATGRRVFAMPVRVYFQDTDAGGIVYHGIYVNFFERARMEWLRAIGFEVRRLVEEFGVMFVVRTLAVRYRLPARLDEELRVSVAIARAGGATLDLVQDVTRDGDMLVEAQVGLACVSSADLKPARVPAALRATCTDWSTGTMST